MSTTDRTILDSGLGKEQPAQPLQPALNLRGQLKNLLRWEDASLEIKKLNDLCETSRRRAEVTRENRFFEVDLQTERESGRLQADELVCPVRLVDSNITREQSRYVNYLISSNRAAIFQCIENPTLPSIDALELDFTRCVRYEGWSFTAFNIIDCMQLHGYSLAEVLYDPAKAGNFCIDYCNFEDLGFYGDTRNLQSCEILIRRYRFTKSEVVDAVEDRGWNSLQAQKIISASDTDSSTDTSLQVLQKVYFRINKVVQVAWACDGRCDDWLKAPSPLDLGRKEPEIGQDGKPMLDSSGTCYMPGKPLTEVNYPITLLPYRINEDKTIYNLKGRIDLDLPTQNVVISLLSNFATASRRASQPYFSKDESDPDQSNKQTNIRLEPGALFDGKLKSFALAYPDSEMLQGIQGMISNNLQESGNVDFAATNRKDSRKTAQEVSASTQQQQQLSMTQVALFSASWKTILTMCWRIYSNRVLVGLIKPSCDIGFFKFTYNLKPAGDVDVVERAEKIQKMMQAWPVVQNIPALATPFLKKLLQLLFPEDAPEYIQALQDDETKTNLIKALSTALNGALMNPDGSGYTEEAKRNVPALQQLQQQVSAVLNTQQSSKGNNGKTTPVGQ